MFFKKKSSMYDFYRAYLDLLKTVDDLSVGIAPDEDAVIRLLKALPNLFQAVQKEKASQGLDESVWLPCNLAPVSIGAENNEECRIINELIRAYLP